MVLDQVMKRDYNSKITQYYIRNRPKQTKNLLTGESISLLSQNLSPFQNPKSNLIVFCAFISSRKALVVRSQIES